MDTRFEYERDRDEQLPQDTSPTLTVQGAFTGGGSNDGTSRTNGDHYELQNYSTASFKTHSLRFGTRLRAYRESDYSNAGTNGNYNFDSAAAFIAGTPSQGSVTKITNFNARATLFDAALFYQDDWKVNRKLTFDYGLRFEAQNRIHDHADWGPRIGFAYALDGGKKRPPKTVIRAGYGWFFNRFSNASVIQAIHQNGINQQQIVYSNPTYVPGKPPSGAGTVSSRSASYSISPKVKAALDMQGAVGVDRKITKAITANVTYLYSRGIHQYLTDNINAPLYDYATNTFIIRSSRESAIPVPRTRQSLPVPIGRRVPAGPAHHVGQCAGAELFRLGAFTCWALSRAIRAARTTFRRVRTTLPSTTAVPATMCATGSSCSPPRICPMASRDRSLPSPMPARRTTSRPGRT